MSVRRSANAQKSKMDEDHDELRFVCKLCDKRFASGKSLGGHMRAHVMAANSAESDDKFEHMNKHSSLIVNGNDSNSKSYVLRKNPKRSLRASSSSSTLPFTDEMFCRQCGKGFQSLKALCGHMAFHSEKDKDLKDYDYSWTSENLEDHSDTEEMEQQDPVSVTRSKSNRYKNAVVKPASVSLTHTNSSNSNYNYGSSSVSETDEFEQEGLARCLMMLSRDSMNLGGVNSVVLETKLSSIEMKNNRNECNVVKNDAETCQFKNSNSSYCRNGIKKPESGNSVVLETNLSSTGIKNRRKEWDVVNNDAQSFPFESSNSRFCRNGIKKLESGNSVNGLLRNGVKEFNYKDLSYEEKQEIRRNLFRELGYDNSLKKITRNDDSCKKRSKYECDNCNKTFSSFQGLGGHRPCHKKSNAFNACENGSEREYAGYQKPELKKKTRPKKNKEHECPVCFRLFKSGQALGGHKRSHFINGSEDRDDYVAAMSSTYTDMIDLNLPAPEED